MSKRDATPYLQTCGHCMKVVDTRELSKDDEVSNGKWACSLPCYKAMLISEITEMASTIREPRGPNHTWTTRQIEFCGSLWRKGATQTEIADALAVEYGLIVTHNSISRLAARHRDIMPRRTNDEFRAACRRKAIERRARERV